MRRGMQIAAVAAALAVGATACSSGGSGKSAAAGTTKDPAAVSGSVTFWDTSDAKSEAPAYKKLIADFEAKYPKITVSYQNVPFGDIENKFKTAAQSGTGAPDVFRSDVSLTAAYAALGYLQPLEGTPALANDSDYRQTPYSATKYNGKIYGVPQVNDALAFIYNKALFAKAGITTPPATWDDVKADAPKLKAVGVNAVVAYNGNDSFYSLPFIYGEGGKLVDVNAKKALFSDPATVKGFQDAKDLVDSGAAMTDVTKDAYGNLQTAFQDGKVAAVINGPWSVADDLSSPAFSDAANVGIAPVPAGGSGKSGTPMGGQALDIYAGSKNLDATYLFVAFLNSAESQTYITQQNHTLPTRQSVYTSAAVTGNPVTNALVPVLETAIPSPAIPQSGDLFTPLKTAWSKMLGGQADAQSALTEGDKGALQVLGSGWS